MAINPSQTIPVFQTADVPAGVSGTPASDLPKPKTTTIKENQMADVDTQLLSGQHSDIRREQAEHFATTQLENMKGFDRINADVLKSGWENTNSIKDARFDINSRVQNATDTVNDRFFTTEAQIADIQTSVSGLGYQIRDGFAAAAKDSEINALRTQIELAKNQTYVSDKIDAGNQRITDLMNALRDSDQNRLLVERNTELVASLNDGRWWRDWGHFRGAYDSNVQAVNSRLNSVDSQFEATRQGMVNFGTMAGVGQSSTSNNVK